MKRTQEFVLFGLFMASVLQQGSLNRLHNRWRRLAKCHMAPTLKVPYYANVTSLLPAISDNSTSFLSVGELRRNEGGKKSLLHHFPEILKIGPL